MLNLFSQVQFFEATLWTIACQAPLSMRFSRQEYWSGLLEWEFLIMYFHNLENFHRNSTWQNSIYQETVFMIIFHVFLGIIALL